MEGHNGSLGLRDDDVDDDDDDDDKSCVKKEGKTNFYLRVSAVLATATWLCGWVAG